MPNPFLGVRIPPEVDEALMAQVKATGQSKSDVVIDALKAYLEMTPQHDKITELEMRLSVLEAQLEQLTRHTHSVEHHPESQTINHSIEE
ncbi:MAG: ribbon-helix-helix protein, CopG family [Microcoleaceae cyanobacterium]